MNEHDGDFNAALEDLKRSNEAKKESFMNKMKFWNTSNEAKLSSAEENVFEVFPDKMSLSDQDQCDCNSVQWTR